MAQLDKIFKEKLDSFEVDYNPNHWDEMENMLDKNPISSTPKNWKKYVGYAASVALITSAVVYFAVENSTTKDNTSADKVQPTTEDFNNNTLPTLNNNKEETTNEVTSTNNSNEILDKNNNENIEDSYTEINQAASDNRVDNQTNDVNSNSSNNPDKNNTPQNDKLSFVINSNKKSVCQGEVVKLAVSKKSGPDQVTYNWYINNELKHIGETFVYTSGNAGDKIVKVEATADKISTTSEIEIKVVELPKFDLEIVNQERTIADPYTSIVASNSSLQYEWRFNNEKKTGSNFIHEFEKAGNYDIEVSATNGNCKTEKPKIITVNINSNLTLAPNSFIPEMGVNDDQVKTFFAWALKNHDLQFELIIKDINGKEVYRTNEIAPWNGRLNNTGDMLPVGNYFWILNVTNNKGQNNLYTDIVKLVKK